MCGHPLAVPWPFIVGSNFWVIVYFSYFLLREAYLKVSGYRISEFSDPNKCSESMWPLVMVPRSHTWVSLRSASATVRIACGLTCPPPGATAFLCVFQSMQEALMDVSEPRSRVEESQGNKRLLRCRLAKCLAGEEWADLV